MAEATNAMSEKQLHLADIEATFTNRHIDQLRHAELIEGKSINDNSKLSYLHNKSQ
jgi:hypothetical protein